MYVQLSDGPGEVTRKVTAGNRVLVVRHDDMLPNQRYVASVEVVGVYKNDGTGPWAGAVDVIPDAAIPQKEREEINRDLRAAVPPFQDAIVRFDPQNFGCAMSVPIAPSDFYPAKKSV